MGLCQIKSKGLSLDEPDGSEQTPGNLEEEEDMDDCEEPTVEININSITTRKLCLQDFELLKVLGRGSFGKVILVRKIDDRKLFAVKIIRKKLLAKKRQKEQAIKEREIMSAAESMYTVKLHYAFQSESRLYLVMDFMVGGELFLHLRKRGRFSEEAAQFYASELVVALEWLHSQNIIYRDLKPENVLLDQNGHLVLTDFGLSKLGFEKNQVAYSFCGTPEYVAPEILYQKGHTNVVDFYSLGALIYEMLCGQPPHYSKDKREMLRNRCEKPLELKQGLSMAAQSLLKSLLLKDPKYRLGANGIHEIKQHSFFFGVDWVAMESRQVQPPIIPKIRNFEDLNNFSQAFTTQPVAETPESKISGAQEHFEGFSYQITN